MPQSKYSFIYKAVQKFGDKPFTLPYAYNEYPLLFEQVTPQTCELIFNNLEQLNAATFRTTLMLQDLIKDEFSAKDSEIKLIIMKGAGNKAFCSGGDLKLFYYSKNEPHRVKNHKLVLEMFNYHDYETINQIKNIKQITMAIYNGIVMGAGVGIATEKSRLAMPEIKLGYFCDCAASYFLPRFSHDIGYFLAFTAKSISGYDLVEAGAATHYIPSNRLDKFSEEINKEVKEDATIDKVQKIVEKYSEKKQVSQQLEEIKATSFLKFINKPFEEFYPEWVKYISKDQKQFNQISPLSLRTTFEMLQRAKNLSLPECLKIDTRLATRLMYHSEFDEGIQNVLFKKQDKPKWMFQNPLDIPKDYIEELFKPLEKDKELKV